MNAEQAQEMDEKTISIISYITIVGWMIAYIRLSKSKSPLAVFHIRQSLFLMLCAFGVCVAQMLFAFIPYLGWIISISLSVVLIGFLILWIIGLINAINGEQKSLPIVGNRAQDLLKGIK